MQRDHLKLVTENGERVYPKYEPPQETSQPLPNLPPPVHLHSAPPPPGPRDVDLDLIPPI